jgi:hypothetical protein
MLVTVAAFQDPYEAHLFRGRLQAEGISAFVAHEMHVANKWYLSNALGGVKVQVSCDDIERARGVERACRQGEYRALLQAQIGDLDEPVCPHCGGTEFRRRRPLIRAAVAIAVSLSTATVWPPTGWILCCQRCFREFRAPHRPVSWSKAAGITTTVILFVISEWMLLRWFYKAFGCPPGSDCV